MAICLSEYSQQIYYKMNKSFQGSQNGGSSRYHLPNINQSLSVNAQTNKIRSQSISEINPQKIPITRRLVNIDSLAKIQDYQEMSQKQLLRQHQELLKVLKKYQQIIDINLVRKQKQKSSNRGKSVDKEQLIALEAQNNKKIIENYLKQIKDLENIQKMRTLNEVLNDKAQVNEKIAKVKKQIFNLKNQDVIAGSKLINERGQIQRDVKEIQRDLKVQLTKNSQYKKKIEELTQMLKQLRKDSEGNQNIKSSLVKKEVMNKLQQKKKQLEDLNKMFRYKEQSIQDVMINKTKRNKGVTKDIEVVDKKIAEVTQRIQLHKEKLQHYHKFLEQNH